LERVIEL
jgi:hypothetical protein